MSAEFVPGSVGVHDAAGIYHQAREFYAYLLKSEKESDDLLVKANAQLKLAQETRPGLVHHAEEVQSKALEISYRVREIRVQTMNVYVQTIGSILGVVQGARLKVENPDGLEQFDLDLSRVQQRYDELYAPFFANMKDVRDWDNTDWATFHVRIAGPVLLWETISECANRWAVPGVPPCHGPDYLHAWILANQSDVMMDAHIHALESLADEVLEFFRDKSKFLVTVLADAAEGIVLIGAQAAKGIVKGLSRTGIFPLALIGGAVFLIVKTSKRK